MATRSIYFRAIVAGLTLSIWSYEITAQTVQDFDGNNYRVIKAGRYQWMAENLRVMHDPQGNSLDCYTIENPYMDTCHYGILYNWSTAMDSAQVPGSQGICPQGWHIPTDAEWDSLTEWAGGIRQAGLVLKRQAPDEFGVIMAGNYNFIQQADYYFGQGAYFWTSDSFSPTAAWMRHFGLNLKNINRSTVAKHYGFSIRCVRGLD